MKKIFKTFLTLFLRVGISILLLLFLFRQVDSKKLFEIIKHADWRILFITFLITFLAYVTCLFRWQMLLKATKIHIKLKRIIISFAGGTFFNLFLPSTIGGDLVRSIDLGMHTNRLREVVATVLLDRLSGYFALVAIGLLATLLGWGFIDIQYRPFIFISIGIITGVLVIALFILFNEFIYSKVNKLLHSERAGRIRESITNLHQEIYIFKRHKRMMLNNLALSVLIQMTQPFTTWLIALALGIKINIVYFFIFVPVITAITFLPISIGGLGLRDVTTVLFFSKVGISKDLAFSMSLLTSTFIFLYGIIGGLIYVLTVRHRRKQYHKPHPIHPHS